MAGGQRGLSPTISVHPRTAPFLFATLSLVRTRAKQRSYILIESATRIPQKQVRLDVRAKLLSMDLEPLDEQADGNCFLRAATFALFQLRNWSIL